MLIEQAIFTSARTSQGTGYHLVAKSPGITPEEAAELSVLGPSHGSLRDQRPDAASVNFLFMSAGQVCISKSMAAGEEYSQRGGARIYTHFLILPNEVFLRFANQPFTVLRAAWAKGLLDVPEKPPASLQPFTLAGRVARVDEGLLAQFAEELGPQRVAHFIEAALSPGIKAITGIEQSDTVFAGLSNCLPVECRREITFTTGLRYSPQRPFKLFMLDENPDEQRRVARQAGITIVDLSAAELAGIRPQGWAKYVATMIEADCLPLLTTQIQTHRPSLSIEHLDELGERLLQEFRQSPAGRKSLSGTGKPGRSMPVTTQNPRRALPDATILPNDSISIADHSASASIMQIDAPRLADLSGPSDTEAIDLVEQLDDAVYEAINGDSEAADQAQSLWNELSARLPEATVLKLREQYMRYTLSLWEACLDNGVREPGKAAGAIDVLTLLFGSE